MGLHRGCRRAAEIQRVMLEVGTRLTKVFEDSDAAILVKEHPCTLPPCHQQGNSQGQRGAGGMAALLSPAA